jgi:aminopeptidase N
MKASPQGMWTPWCLTALLAAGCGAPQEPPQDTPPPAEPPPATTVASASPPPPTLRLPSFARPERYDLNLTLDPAQERFRGVIGIDLKLTEASSILWLNRTNLTINHAEVTAGGQALMAHPVNGGEDFIGFTLDRPIGPGSARLTIAYEGLLDKERSLGLYRQSEGTGPDDAYIYSFFEPLDARRAFPCFDEPSYKVPWKISLRVKKGHVALSNARVEKEVDDAAGMKTVTFEETRPLPSYLVALIVGPFDLVNAGDAGHHKTPLRFAVPRGRGPETRYAAEVTPRIVGLLEDYFGMPYPYGKLDVAVVPRYWGTMEHPGLVALGQPLTLIKPAEETPQRKQSYANIAAHELAHYWFGDYVTMEWWDDIWLNESLATFLDARITNQIEPSWTYNLTQLEVRSFAMNADSLATAKKIREPILSKNDIANAFDADITYMKGASILGMFERFVGPERFQKGIRRFMKEHAWGNAKADDLLGALSAEAGQDLGPAMKTFLDQPGIPLITAEPTCEKGSPPKLKLAQRRLIPIGSTITAGSSWQVPVCVKYGSKKGVGKACSLLSTPSAEIALDAEKGCPEWVMPNEGAAGHYRSSYSPATLSRLFGQDAAKLTPAERVALLGDTRALVDTGALPLGDALALSPAMLKDADRHVLTSSILIVGAVRRDLLSEELRAKFAKFVRKLYGEKARALGFLPKPGEDDGTRLLRPRLLGLAAFGGEDPALQKEGHELAQKWLRDHAAVAPELASLALRIAAMRRERTLFEQLRAAAKATADHRERSMLLSPLGGFRDPALTGEALGILLGAEFDLRDSLGLLWTALYERETRELAYDFLKKNFDALAGRMRPDESMQLLSMPTVYCDEAHRADAAAFFTERAKKIEGGPRTLSNTLEEVGLCAAQHKLHQKSVEAFLTKL